MRELILKANVLHEALPYIQRFHGRTIVIKYGGHAMLDEGLREGFAKDVALLKAVGLRPVVVHGGGPQIDQALARFGVVSERIDGLRVTDESTMEVVEMVLSGQVNREIVSRICRWGGRAVGLSGRDDGLVKARKVLRLKTKSGAEVDPGRVGEVTGIRTELITRMLDAEFIPVIAPIAVDAEGRALNVNADFVASQVAKALSADKLVMMTDIQGVNDADGKRISSLTEARALSLIADGTISGGMIPKVQSVLEALGQGVSKVHVIDGRVEHAIMLEIFTDDGVGTEITASPDHARAGTEK